MLRLILIHAKKSKQESGFTLIELIIVLMIIGVLTAIALPSMMGQIGKAREAEAKLSLSTIAKGQELYFAEHGSFADTLGKLEIGLSPRYYTYDEPNIVSTGVVKHQAIAQNAANNNIRNYGLGIYYNGTGSFLVILCQSDTPITAALADNNYINGCTNGNQIK